MIYVKDTYSPEKLEAASLQLWKSMWNEHKDLSKPEIMRECLMHNFTAQEADDILNAAKSPPIKEKLLAQTGKAVESGAFGCPWFQVTNSKGLTEPFFGSDR
jgi:glutathione S-transferase kappa 1